MEIRKGVKALYGLVLLAMMLPGSAGASDNSSVAYKWFSSCVRGDVIVSRSDFEEGVGIRYLPSSKSAVFESSNILFECSGDWRSTKGSSYGFNGTKLNFEVGSERDRWVKILRFPGNSSNHVMQFGVQKPHRAGKKGRVQMDVSTAQGAKVLRVSTRMYLGPGFETVRNMPGKNDWLAISSWWNNPVWANDPYPFVISVDLVKPDAGAPGALNFKIRARGFNRSTNKWNAPMWRTTNRSFSVPTGQWMRLEYEVVEGNGQTGLFKLDVTTQDGRKHNIFNIRNFTHHPRNSKPAGFVEFSPLKLYTSDTIINYVTGHGEALTVNWDDLTIIGCRNKNQCNNVSPARPPVDIKAFTVKP